MKTFPTLYKRTNTGAIETWKIKVYRDMVENGVIRTEYGHVGGKMQETSDTISTGKNLGKKNATTAYEQAVLEAEAKWKKKQARERYVTDPDRAAAGDNDTEGGVPPMLAKPREDVKKIAFPADYQRKLNGVRCIATIEDGAVSLWSRKQTRILGVPHIQAAYERAFKDIEGKFTFDGEVYRHGWSLQKISGYARKADTKPDFEQLCHYVYDMPSVDGPWSERRAVLEAAFERPLAGEPALVRVETVEVASMEDADRIHDAWVQEGYEGGIIRVKSTKYEFGKRSAGLIKVKRFRDAEFTIHSVGDGRGRFAGKAIFTCLVDPGKPATKENTFECCAPGTMEDRAEFMRRAAELVGKQLTVKFFEYSDDHKPLFPVGMAVRDYE